MADPDFAPDSVMDSTTNSNYRSPLFLSPGYNLDDVVPSTGGSTVTQQTHMDATHDQLYGGHYDTTNVSPQFLPSLFRLENANIAGYIQQLHDTHCRFRAIIFDLTTFFYSRETMSDNPVAAIFFSAWIQKHEAVLRGPCFQESCPAGLTHEVFRRLGTAMLPRTQHVRVLPSGMEDGKVDIELIQRLFGEAEDARVRFCEAFNALGSIARSGYPSGMAADPGSHSSSDFDVFLQWYTGSWCTGVGQVDISLPVQCPLERVELQQVRELICGACVNIRQSSSDNGPEREWLADFKDDLQRYQDRVKRLRAYEIVLTSQYGPRAISTQRIRRDIFKASYKLLDCQLNMADRIFGTSPGLGDAFDLGCHYFEALCGQASTSTCIRMSLPAALYLAP